MLPLTAIFVTHLQPKLVRRLLIQRIPEAQYDPPFRTSGIYLAQFSPGMTLEPTGRLIQVLVLLSHKVRNPLLNLTHGRVFDILVPVRVGHVFLWYDEGSVDVLIRSDDWLELSGEEREEGRGFGSGSDVDRTEIVFRQQYENVATLALNFYVNLSVVFHFQLFNKLGSIIG
jgi:hypothetical protein